MLWDRGGPDDMISRHACKTRIKGFFQDTGLKNQDSTSGQQAQERSTRKPGHTGLWLEEKRLGYRQLSRLRAGTTSMCA
jgi:hypothetical protein